MENEKIKVTIAGIREPLHEEIGRLLRSYRVDLTGRDAYIKVNAVDFRKGCYTSPRIIAETIKALYKIGAEKVYVMENSTQGNFTRLVFRVTGVEKVVRDCGAKPIYLDEEKAVKVEIGDFRVDFPKIVYEEIVNGDSFYLSMPKLKTHDMTTVTLNLKNQFGFIYHKDRRVYHSKFDLHKFIAAIYDFIKPNFSVIDGEYAIIHGHYPLEKMFEKFAVPMGILIASPSALAADIVAARMLGYEVEEVNHLRIAEEKYKIAGKIEVEGEDRVREGLQTGKFPCKPLGIYPKGVTFVKGKERACNEGCLDNTLMVLEMLHVDYGADGEFSIVFGKGFDREEIENLKEPILVVGKCAAEEVGEFLKQKYKRVRIVPYCNDLAAVTDSLLKFTGLKATDIVPISTASLIVTWLKAKLRGSTALTPSIF